jgi:hypothetical protein
MSLTNTENFEQYDGDDLTTDFTVTFPFQLKADLAVKLIAAGGAETDQVLDTDYTVVGDGDDDGGVVTMVTAPATGEILVIERVLDPTQTTQLSNVGEAYPETIEQALDRLTMLIQQIERSPFRVIGTGTAAQMAALEIDGGRYYGCLYLVRDGATERYYINVKNQAGTAYSWTLFFTSPV